MRALQAELARSDCRARACQVWALPAGAAAATGPRLSGAADEAGDEAMGQRRSFLDANASSTNLNPEHSTLREDETSFARRRIGSEFSLPSAGSASGRLCIRSPSGTCRWSTDCWSSTSARWASSLYMPRGPRHPQRLTASDSGAGTIGYVSLLRYRHGSTRQVPRAVQLANPRADDHIDEDSSSASGAADSVVCRQMANDHGSSQQIIEHVHRAPVATQMGASTTRWPQQRMARPWCTTSSRRRLPASRPTANRLERTPLTSFASGLTGRG